MPSRNIIRQDAADSFYHIYARGVNKDLVFLEPSDKDYFISLLARYLSKKVRTSVTGVDYPHYRKKVELLSYCLMDNHFHLLVYQIDTGSVTAFMRSLMTSYSSYFHRKYKRTGPLFESRYKSSLVNKETYLSHISRYIHLNPRSWKRFPYSSFRQIVEHKEPEWLQTDKVVEDFRGRNEYAEFVEDYESKRDLLARIKHELANM